MRISTNQFYMSGLNSILDQQSGLNRTQKQISSGLRVEKPSDDPIASISILNLEQEIALTTRYIANGDQATSNLNVEETTLQTVTDILQRTRELILSGGNVTYGNNERNSLAVEMDELLNQLVGLANSKNSSGDYLFAGHKINVIPFSETSSGNYTYNGDQGTRNIQISSSTQIEMNDSGYEVFQNMLNGNGDFATSESAANIGSGIINTGSVIDQTSYISDTYTINTYDVAGTLNYEVRDSSGIVVNDASGTPIINIPYSAGENISFNGVDLSITGTPVAGDSFTLEPSRRQDIFETLQNAITALKTNVTAPNENAHMNNALNRALVDLDQGMRHIGTIHAKVGTRLNILQSQNLFNNDLIITSKLTLSKVRDLDLATAITDLNLRKVGLEAAQASFVRIQNLSLFNFLR